MDASGILQVVENCALVYPDEQKAKATSVGSSTGIRQSKYPN